MIGDHPTDSQLLVVVREGGQATVAARQIIEFIPEPPRKVEGWVLVNRKSGANSLFSDYATAVLYSSPWHEIPVYVSGTEGVEP